MKKIISLVIAIACITTIKAQYVADALRYSQNFPTLSARSLSMGSAFTSLGGDFSSTYINPAGLGLYRKSEFVFSPGLGYASTNATYLGQKNQDYKYQFILGNIGYVGTYNSQKDKGLVSATFAAGYNRLNNFGNTSYIRAINSTSSYADYFSDNAQGNDPEDLNAFYERLAFDAYVIDTIAPNFSYGNVVGEFGLPVTQRRIIKTEGGTGQWTFATGFNFSNVFYVGFGIGVYTLNFEQKNIHTEMDHEDRNPFDHFTFTENLDVEGTGFSANFGMLVRLLKIMRIGANLQLPTYYKLSEAYMNSMYSEFDDGFIPSEANGDIYAEGTYEYKLRTPLKLNGGASIQIGKSGIIAADLEYIDYESMLLRDAEYNDGFENENTDIANIYRPVLNVKLGGELRFDNLSVRLGGGLYPSVYESDELNKDSGHSEITAGFGYRNSSFFFDLGMSALMHTEKYNLYYDNIATLKQPKYRFIATLGFRF
jgi:hypothetical protein